MRKTAKSQATLKEDVEDDAADYARRLERAKPFVEKRMAARLERLRGSVSDPPAGSSGGDNVDGRVSNGILNGTLQSAAKDRNLAKITVRDGMTHLYHVLQRGLNKRPWIVRVAILFVIALCVTALQEPVTAATITLTVLPHQIFDFYRGITAWIAKHNNGSVHNEEATASMLVLVTTLAIVSTLWRRHNYLLLEINAVYILIFPDIYPEEVRDILSMVTFDPLLGAHNHGKDVRDQAQGTADSLVRSEPKSASDSKDSAKKPIPKSSREDTDFEPLKDYYTLVGESYVHGMMNGHAIEWQNQTAGPDFKAGRVKAEIFEIR
ncbi:hypothetical protein LTR15_007569 [Elasticomyces elasticus]|nr:hypothetical protein LTR15_007569 [Elasticomyces elasticus]